MRSLPLILVVALAVLAEPLRAGFALADQTCAFLPTRSQLFAAPFNLRHLIGYGIIFLVAAATFRDRPLAKAALFTFVLSVLLELLQTRFSTGHCRAWDLIPNALAIGLGAFAFELVRRMARPAAPPSSS